MIITLSDLPEWMDSVNKDETKKFECAVQNVKALGAIDKVTEAEKIIKEAME